MKTASKENNKENKKEISGNQKEGQVKIKPIADRILIRESKETKEKKTASGIIIPVTVEGDKESKRGEVVAIGEGKYEDGKLIPVSIKVGDEVLFQWGDKIKINDEEYYIVRESEILAIIN